MRGGDRRGPPQAARRAGRRPQQDRLVGGEAARARCSCGRPSPTRSARSARWSSPSCSSRRRGWRCRPASASASTARATSASRSSRTSSASGRRCAGLKQLGPLSRRGPCETTSASVCSGSAPSAPASSRFSRRSARHPRGARRLPASPCRASPTSTSPGPARGSTSRALPLVGDAARVLDDPAIDIVVELVGGLEPARTFILQRAGGRQARGHRQQGAARPPRRRALRRGAAPRRDARPSRRRWPAASRSSAPSRTGSSPTASSRVAGIVNGTCNYVLSKMTDEGLDFSRGAQGSPGPAATRRPIPTLDIEGIDSAHKLQILVVPRLPDLRGPQATSTPRASRASPPRTSTTRASWATASSCWPSPRPSGTGGVEVRVHPTMIPAALAAGRGVRRLQRRLHHRRRGRRPDVLRARRRPAADRLRGVVGRRSRSPAGIAHGIPAAGARAARRWARPPLPLRPMDDVRCGYYLRVMAQDRPGVLSRVTGVLGDHDISIAVDDPEGPRHARGRPRGHDDPRGARARHARRPRRGSTACPTWRPPPTHDSRGGRPRVSRPVRL